jgi:hypothetical protein
MSAVRDSRFAVRGSWLAVRGARFALAVHGSRYEGSWRLCDENGQTVILYELSAEPSFDVPQFLLKRLLRRDAGLMIEGLRREIAERSARTTAREP